MRRVVALLAAGLVLQMNFSATAESTRDIWLAPLDQDHSNGSIGVRDFAALFRLDAPWGDVANRVTVFKLYPFFTARSSDEELTTLITDLRRRGIALALEARVLTDEAACKGDGGANTLKLLLRLKRLGADLRYLAMDEPMKHWRFVRSNCQVPLDAIAKNIAANLRGFKAIFPNLEVGDIEPVGEFKEDPNLASDILEFLTACEQAMGRPIAFFHSDVIWHSPWLGLNRRLGKMLRGAGIPFGMIYNGTDRAVSDEQWANEAVSHFVEFEAEGQRPDAAIFQSWTAHPTRVLPESDPVSLTGIALRYFRFQGRLGKQSD